MGKIRTRISIAASRSILRSRLDGRPCTRDPLLPLGERENLKSAPTKHTRGVRGARALRARWKAFLNVAVLALAAIGNAGAAQIAPYWHTWGFNSNRARQDFDAAIQRLDRGDPRADDTRRCSCQR
jgi:hypothetical protein